MSGQTAKISQSLFDHLLYLAAIKLPREDIGSYLMDELNNQLSSIDELLEIVIPERVPASTHGIEMLAREPSDLRKDHWEIRINPDAILSQAPMIRERYIVVHEQRIRPLE